MGHTPRVLMIATSYPRSAEDWQGLFIRKIADALASRGDIQLSLWAPDGPRLPAVEYACSAADAAWLGALSDAGGIAHGLRSNPLTGAFRGVSLLARLRRLYRERREHTDIFHVNWLQNALPLYGMNARAVITVLGTDFQLLKLPGMVRALRAVLGSNRCVLAPNAQWMASQLETCFGDLAQVVPTNFGIDQAWFELATAAPGEHNRWLSVFRLTNSKIGPLFDWGEDLFNGANELHLLGPNQEQLELPDWLHYHGSTTADELISRWYPGSCGFITLSQHAEGRPQVLLETMAAGMPVIASDIPAHRETIEHGRHGYLVNTAAEFRQALANLSDPATHAGLARHCRSDSLARFGTWNDCAGRYHTLYGKLL